MGRLLPALPVVAISLTSSPTEGTCAGAAPLPHEQRVILRATAGNLPDHTVISLALGRVRWQGSSPHSEDGAYAGGCNGIGYEKQFPPDQRRADA